MVITVAQITGNGSPAIGALTVSVIGDFRNFAKTSLPSQSVSPVLSGDWGLLPGPTITQFVADDPDNADGYYSNLDTLTIQFSEITNQPDLSTTAAVNLVFNFSASIGTLYTGVWSGLDTAILTIVNAAGASPPVIGNGVSIWLKWWVAYLML